MTLTRRKAASIEEFHSLVEEGYYQSEVRIDKRDSNAVLFQLESMAAGLIPITRFRGADVGVRRGWDHIKARSSEIYVVWFPLAGSISITQDSISNTVTEVGQFVITSGDRPFFARALARDEQYCSQMHVLVPSHIIRSLLPNVDKICGRPFLASSGSAHIARNVFGALIDQADSMSDQSAAKLGLAGLEAIADSIKDEVSGELLNVDIKKTHLDRVHRFIEKHLSMQGLTADKVAASCKISRRYLHYLMRSSDTTFGEYLWEARLKQAQEWLSDPEFRHFHIVDIAYMCGFRSASHFSNAYRARYGHPPSDARRP